jgi:6-phosphogluconolactonase
MSEGESGRRVVVESSIEDATRFVAELFETIICEAVDARGACRVALAGGTTPHRLYQHLASKAASGKVPWNKTEVFFGDERDVPHDNVDSNYGMAQRTLLDNVPIQPSRIHPMPADAEDLPSAAGEYEQIIRAAVPAGPDGIPRFDLILLGMGGDGHVASLFPHTDALNETERLVLACFVPVLGRQRMTFAFPLINAAHNVILLVTGEDKAEAVAGILGDDEETRRRLPGARVGPEGALFVVLDAGAASRTGLRPKEET